MFLRFLSSAPIGIAVTATLMYIMQFLVQTGPGLDLDQRPVPKPVFLSPKIDTPVAKKQPEIKRIDDPRPPPPMPPQERYSGEAVGVGTGLPLPSGPHQQRHVIDFANADGALVNIIRVRPNYPVVAAQRGLEGFVVVRFDVTPLGTVENVTVVESSNRIFDNAAIAAALRFRYKARVVDGVAQTTTGLMNKFVFEMEE